MKSTSIRERLLASTFLGLAAATLAAAPALAQSGTQGTPVNPRVDQPAPGAGTVQPGTADEEEARNQSGEPVSDDQSEVEAVVVTGSRIRRDPTNAPTPLIQLNREEIIQSGEPNIVDYLADVPALQLSQVPEDTVGATLGIAGLSLLNLRGLGTQRTLVLVDGRRHVPGSPGTSSVDVDTIPSLLIESTEVITGAASAQYGADAVSGVVNFILRRNFDGIEIDGSYAQVNQDGQSSRRLSGLFGKNLLNDRLNVYFFAERQEIDEILDSDIDFLRRGRITLQNDLDPSAQQPDGIIDVITGEGYASLGRVRGGGLTLATTPRPSATSDPDIPVAACPTAGFNANCFVIDPGVTFVFNNQGVGRPINFGTGRVGAGLNRTNVQNSPDALPFTAFQASRSPLQEANRFQTGLNFNITDELQLFGEYKYAEETTVFGFQPAFFDVQIRPRPTANALTPVNPNAFTIGTFTDNAFLDPAIATLINNNQRPIFSAPTATSPGVQTGTTPDPRAVLRIFTNELGTREQQNDRETQRFVLGLRGDRDNLFGFINDLSYEIGYTWGEVSDVNNEFGTVDFERFNFGLDAVRDVNNETGRGANAIVCRVQLLAARGVTIPRGQGGTYAANDPTIQGCTPFRIFGEGGVTPEVREYVLVDQITTNRAEQEDVLAFASGTLWDLWGAGPLGFAVGAEYRKETAGGVGTEGQNEGRTLFANFIANFPEQSYDVSEFFAELRVPLIRDLPFIQDLEMTLTGRRSDYSTIGKSDTYGIAFQYRPTRDVLFRANYGRSVRAPNISELFQPLSQTFLQINDTCSRTVIDATQDPTLRANRNANCAALGVPTNYIDPNPGSSNPGRFGGNELLNPETSDSYTASVVLTPRFLPRFSMVLDWFDINIQQAIATLGVQAILQNCTDVEGGNPSACALITRDPATFEITDFVQGPLNFASLRTRGLDFNARYRVDLADMPFVGGRDLGRLDFSLRGTYLIRRQNFVNPTNPGQATNLDSTVGYPRMRFLFGTTYTPFDKLALSWEMDFIGNQEINDDVVLLNDPDNREAHLLNTDNFVQHDFSFRYDLTDNVRLRGGVTNAFDAEPTLQAEILGGANWDIFDLWGRRFFVGFSYRR